MSNHEEIGHAIPKSTIVGSYFALLFLTAVMLGLSHINTDRLGIDWVDLHAVKSCLIMSVALVMGLIVSMFLMGLRYESKLLNLTIFVSNFAFLLIFVLFTWVDTSFRGEVDPSFAQKINFISPVKEEAAEEHGAAVQAAPAAVAAPAAPVAAKEMAPAATAAPATANEAAPATKAAPAAKEAVPAKAAAPAH